MEGRAVRDWLEVRVVEPRGLKAPQSTGWASGGWGRGSSPVPHLRVCQPPAPELRTKA